MARTLSERLEAVGAELSVAYAREEGSQLPSLPRDEIEEAITLLREAAELARRVEGKPLRDIALRNLRSLIEIGSTDKALMLMNLEEL